MKLRLESIAASYLFFSNNRTLPTILQQNVWHNYLLQLSECNFGKPDTEPKLCNTSSKRKGSHKGLALWSTYKTGGISSIFKLKQNLHFTNIIHLSQQFRAMQFQFVASFI